MICHRCPDEMVDDGEWFVCPCCRCRTRGIERQEARFKAHMAELGMTEEQYTEHCSSLMGEPPEPLSPERVKALTDRLAAEWKPACEHDTVNPFLPVAEAS